MVYKHSGSIAPSSFTWDGGDDDDDVNDDNNDDEDMKYRMMD